MSDTPPYGFPPETSNSTGPAPDHRRSYVVDPRSVTGTWHIARGKYGRRPGDRPVWWVLAYHFGKGAAGLLPYLLALWLAKRLGIDVSPLLKIMGGA